MLRGHITQTGSEKVGGGWWIKLTLKRGVRFGVRHRALGVALRTGRPAFRAQFGDLVAATLIHTGMQHQSSIRRW
jgi:hypothetical protein